METSVGNGHAGFITDPLHEAEIRTSDAFLDVLERELDRLAQASGAGLKADRNLAALAHARWASQASARVGRTRGDPALIQSAELALALLHDDMTVRCETAGRDAPTPLGKLLASWPAGVVAFQVALRVYAAGRLPHRLKPPSRASDLAFWGSIRENIWEEPGAAQPFLQILAGEQPDWHYWAAATSGVFMVIEKP